MSEHRQELLDTVVHLARTVFAAQAASVALVDTTTSELVFVSVSGEGEGTLVDARYPSVAGIAGAVLVAEEPLVLDDVRRDVRFARTIAESTGYVPRALMAAPLLRGERALGVLTVLDRGATGRGTLEEIGLLVAFAGQAAAIVEATAGDEATTPGAARIARVAALLERAPDERRAAGERLLDALTDLLGA